MCFYSFKLVFIRLEPNCKMSISGKVIKSAVLLLGIQLVQRGLGIIGTLVLARLLVPEDFGIIALIVIAMQLFELLVETGTQQYIVQKRTVTNEDLNTAWSLDVLTKTVMALIVIAISPLLAGFFDEPDLIIPLCISALTLPIRALKTPGMMQLARDINYRPMFRLTLWQKGISFFAMMGVALLHPSYWAIVTGNVVSAIILAIGSYMVHPFRPKWSFVHFRKQWRFSQWLLFRGIIGFTRSQIDNLMASKLFGTEKLGGYNLVREIGLLPAINLIIPMQEPLLAALATDRDQPETLSYRTRVSLWVITLITTPIAGFVMAYPDLIVGVLLGSNWSKYASLLTPFGLTFFTYCLFSLVCDAMIAQGKVQFLFLLDVISTIAVVCVLLLAGIEDIETLAWVRAWLAVVTVFAYLVILNYQVHFRGGRLLFLCSPVILGTLCGLYVSSLPPFEILGIFLELFIRGLLFLTVVGAVTYVASVLLLKNFEEWLQIHYLAVDCWEKRV